jgi:AcrR family transcriptional regulator
VLEYLSVDDTLQDGRRRAGARTRRRLLDATRALIAQRGDAELTLRDITDGAQANVASVSYHFGSKDQLRGEAVLEALALFAECLRADLDALPPDAPLVEVARTWCGPVVAAIARPHSEDGVLARIASRVATDAVGGLSEQAEALMAPIHAVVLERLRRLRPDLDEDELLLREECAIGLMLFIAGDHLGVELTGHDEREVRRLVVGAVAGVLGGAPLPG